MCVGTIIVVERKNRKNKADGKDADAADAEDGGGWFGGAEDEAEDGGYYDENGTWVYATE